MNLEQKPQRQLGFGYEPERLLFIYASFKSEIKREIRDWPVPLSNVPHTLSRAVACLTRLGYQHGWTTGLRMAYWSVRDVLVRNTRVLFPIRCLYSRLRLAVGLKPMSYLWGLDRGVPIHRYYLEQFLREFSADIRGHCLEFQEDSYTSRLGALRISKSDILHRDYSNPNATIVADLTKPNDIPSGQFDCIICTYVLNFIHDADKAICELHRMLKPGGVLLVAVPQAIMSQDYAHDLCRWTSEGFRLHLAKFFAGENVDVRAYGNSLTAAGNIRGLVADEFTRSQLDYHDSRFGIVVCARAVKSTSV